MKALAVTVKGDDLICPVKTARGHTVIDAKAIIGNNIGSSGITNIGMAIYVYQIRTPNICEIYPTREACVIRPCRTKIYVLNNAMLPSALLVWPGRASLLHPLVRRLSERALEPGH